MAETIPNPKAPLDCEKWEALLADKMDGTLAPEAEAAFTEHSLSCRLCAGLLEQAREGQQWLKLLEGSAPNAPVALLGKILAKTQGAGHEQDFPIGAGAMAGIGGVMPPGAALATARGAHHARLLMTAAMAFFSVALTLSVAGVRLTSVHAAELRPQAMQATVTRSFYGTKKQVVSFYDNLRLVYEVESKMQDMRRESTPATEPEAQPATKPQSGSGAGSKGKADSSQPVPPASKLHGAASVEKGRPASVQPQQEVLRGWPLEVSFVPNQRRGYIAPLAQVLRVSAAIGPAELELTDSKRLAAAVWSRARSVAVGAKGKERNRI